MSTLSSTIYVTFISSEGITYEEFVFRADDVDFVILNFLLIEGPNSNGHEHVGVRVVVLQELLGFLLGLSSTRLLPTRYIV